MIEHAGKFFTTTMAGYTVDTLVDTKPHLTHVYRKIGVDETNSMVLSTVAQHELYSQNSCPLMVHLFQDFLNQSGIRNIAGSGKVHLQ